MSIPIPREAEQLLLRLSCSPMSAPKSDSTPALSNGRTCDGRRAAAN